jgi:hypothetical protein
LMACIASFVVLGTGPEPARKEREDANKIHRLLGPYTDLREEGSGSPDRYRLTISLC